MQDVLESSDAYKHPGETLMSSAVQEDAGPGGLSTRGEPAVDFNDVFSLRKPKDAKAGFASGLKSIAKGVVAGAAGAVRPLIGQPASACLFRELRTARIDDRLSACLSQRHGSLGPEWVTKGAQYQLSHGHEHRCRPM